MNAYFGKLFDLLRPGGLVLNNGTTARALDDAQTAGDLGDFIETSIFPGGESIHLSDALRACRLYLAR